MPREQFQTLSEPMFYVLLALMNECRGIDVMNKVSEISNSRVVVGPGTVYAMLDKFVKSGVIWMTVCEGRQKSYIVTEYGIELLKAEFVRTKTLYSDSKEFLEELL